ncbi:MAG: O-antigen ligase family protein [Microcoleus anatoxicus]|uniref:O-antigen ligase family protein n=1 Tax=Microcoleus anatoxicus TaxID=2705319 RepID=UPI00366DA37E
MNSKKRLKLGVKLTVENLKSRLQKHPDRSLQTPWNFAQLGVLIFPVIPILGALGIFLGLIGTCSQQKFSQISTHPVNRGFAILSVLLVITAVFANNHIKAFLGLGNFLPFFILFVAFSRLIQTPTQLRQLSWIIVISSIPVIILGFGQQFLGWSGIVQLQPVFGWVLEPTGNPPGRMASVFMYANILACYLTIVFILGLGLCIEGRRPNDCVYPEPFDYAQDKRSRRAQEPLQEEGRRIRETSNELPIPNSQFPIPNSQFPIPNSQFPIPNSPFPIPNSPFPIPHSPFPIPHSPFLFLTFAVLGNAVCLIFTNSRNAWGLAVLAAVAFAVYAGWKKILAAVFSAVGAVFLSAFGPQPLRQYLRTIIPAFFWARLTDEMFPNRPTATLRTTQWQFAWSMTQQRPWTGWGLRNFTDLYEAQMHEWLGHPHSLILMLTAETGIPVTLFFLGLVGWILARGVLLLLNWRSHFPVDTQQQQIEENSMSNITNRVISQDVNSGDRLIFFSYLLAFAACTLFNTVDVTLFDLRVNTISWLLLAAICGIGNRASGIGNRE